jgi:hypothetical protein
MASIPERWFDAGTWTFSPAILPPAGARSCVLTIVSSEWLTKAGTGDVTWGVQSADAVNGPWPPSGGNWEGGPQVTPIGSRAGNATKGWLMPTMQITGLDRMLHVYYRVGGMSTVRLRLGLDIQFYDEAGAPL